MLSSFPAVLHSGATHFPSLFYRTSNVRSGLIPSTGQRSSCSFLKPLGFSMRHSSRADFGHNKTTIVRQPSPRSHQHAACPILKFIPVSFRGESGWLTWTGPRAGEPDKTFHLVAEGSTRLFLKEPFLSQPWSSFLSETSFLDNSYYYGPPRGSHDIPLWAPGYQSTSPSSAFGINPSL